MVGLFDGQGLEKFRILARRLIMVFARQQSVRQSVRMVQI
jgi:hypothetical protein